MVFPFHSVTKSTEETQALGERLGVFLLNEGDSLSRTICFWGDLGSGKTTFVQGIAKGLGISKRLLSPTFIIVRHYDIPSTDRRLYHFDLYRFVDQKDVAMVGLSEILEDSKAIVCIEWPERLGILVPKERIDVRCVLNIDGTHDINIMKAKL